MAVWRVLLRRITRISTVHHDDLQSPKALEFLAVRVGIQRDPGERVCAAPAHVAAADQCADGHRQLLLGAVRVVSVVLHPELDCQRSWDGEALRCDIDNIRHRAGVVLHRFCVGVLVEAEGEAEKRRGCGRG